ncbi:MAG: hypothetical protein ACREBN_09870, partial [Burkholderiaceae bacterium]
ADPRYSWVHVGLRHSIGSASPKYRPWVVGHSTILADDGYLCLSDDHVPGAPSPIARFRATDALRATDIVCAAGVRRLIVIAPESSDPDGLDLGAMAFETLIIVRPDVQNERAGHGWGRRALDAVRRIAPLAPSSGPPVATATAILTAFDRCRPGVHRITPRELAALTRNAQTGREQRAPPS